MDYYPAVYAKLVMRLNGDWSPVPKPSAAVLEKGLSSAGRHLVTTVARDGEGKATGWRTDGVDIAYDDLPVVDAEGRVVGLVDIQDLPKMKVI